MASLGSRSGLIVTVAAVAVMSGLVSCSGESGLGSDATVVDISLGRFVIDPSTLQVPAGDVALRVTNVDAELAHDLVVYGKGTQRLAPGQSQVLEIPDVEAGQYRMWCDVPGHAEQGQVGALVVGP